MKTTHHNSKRTNVIKSTFIATFVASFIDIDKVFDKAHDKTAMKMRHNVLIAAIAIFAAGCGKSPAPTTIATDSAATPTQLTSVFRAVTASGTILPIPELRTHVSPGDTVILEAKVMGTITPFVDNRALFVVGDEGTLTSCDLRGDDDHCKTPWDNCCDDPRDLRAGTATIQIVDAEGQVLKHGIRGVNGLKELSRVRVEGVVAPQSTGTALIINATGIEML